MSNFYKSYDNLAKAAEEIFNRSRVAAEGEELLEMVEVPADKKAMKTFLDKAKRMRITQKEYMATVKALGSDIKKYGEFDKLTRGHKDFKDARQMGYDMGMGNDLPKPGGLEGNNPHKKNTYAYHLWLDLAAEGMADA